MLNSDADKTLHNYRCDDHGKMNMLATYVRTNTKEPNTSTTIINSTTSLHAC